MSYLSVLSSDLSHYLKRFIYKRLFPPNLLAKPTHVLECDYSITNVKVVNDEVVVIYNNVMHNINTDVREQRLYSIKDFAVTVTGEFILQSAQDHIWLHTYCSKPGRSMVLDGDHLFILCYNTITLYALETPLGVLSLITSIGCPVWFVIDDFAQKIIDYDANRLLLLANKQFRLINKTDGSNASRTVTLDCTILHTAVVDDEGKILVFHENSMTLYGSDLECIRWFQPVSIAHVCIHNHTLLAVLREKQLVKICCE